MMAQAISFPKAAHMQSDEIYRAADVHLFHWASNDALHSADWHTRGKQVWECFCANPKDFRIPSGDFSKLIQKGAVFKISNISPDFQCVRLSVLISANGCVGKKKKKRSN